MMIKTTQPPGGKDHEREAFVKQDPATFYIRHPPAPHELDDFLTDDDSLFQTIHMGAAVVDESKYHLVIDGLVSQPYSLTLAQLRGIPSKTVTSFHECYGSPLKPPTEALRRIGNVQWTGVPLNALLSRAGVLDEGRFIWTDGLDRGTFAKVEADRYQKDLPLSKALSDEVIVAYAMNGSPLSKNRGGPVRLIVPGWFGTNSTKWLCRIEVQDRRAPGPFTTTFYNEHYPPDDPTCESKPIWKVQPNSMIVRPKPGARINAGPAEVEGWAWSEDGVVAVDISADEGQTWTAAKVGERTEFSWQRFKTTLTLQPGEYVVLARAKGADGRMQPLGKGRNHVHRVAIRVLEK
jgi:DMSO/TMAO reductase YedYZ molybdopterin-dependent catalytic subunit